jgi:hypothetical protein
MSIAVIIARGANNLEIPCMTFATVEEAEAYLTKVCGPPDECRVWGRVRLRTDEHIMGNRADKFFTSYYDGCGGCLGFSVRKVEHGKPFVGWDLD